MMFFLWMNLLLREKLGLVIEKPDSREAESHEWRDSIEKQWKTLAVAIQQTRMLQVSCF